MSQKHNICTNLNKCLVYINFILSVELNWLLLIQHETALEASSRNAAPSPKNCEMPRTLRIYVYRKLTKWNGSGHGKEDNSVATKKSDGRRDGSVYVFCLKLQYDGTAMCQFI
jgi:hypothetical protein